MGPDGNALFQAFSQLSDEKKKEYMPTNHQITSSQVSSHVVCLVVLAHVDSCPSCVFVSALPAVMCMTVMCMTVDCHVHDCHMCVCQVLTPLSLVCI